MSSQMQAPLSLFAENHRPSKKKSSLSNYGTVLDGDGTLNLGCTLSFWIAFLAVAGLTSFFGNFSDTFLSGTSGLIIGVISTLACIMLLLVTFVISHRKQKQLRVSWLARNDLDFATSRMIQTRIAPLLSSPPPSTANPSAYQMRIYQGLSVGEVNRHFDHQTQAFIAGWIDYQLGILGRGGGLQVENVGLAFGRTGIASRSQIGLAVAETTWVDLLGDSFIAVIEQIMPNGMVDTLRIVVPSEPAIRKFIEQFVYELCWQFGDGSHCHEALATIENLPLHVSYISDRLNAILRMPPASRPTVNVIGAMLSEHIMLGEALQFGNDWQTYNLFPLSICMIAREIAKEADTAFLS